MVGGGGHGLVADGFLAGEPAEDVERVDAVVEHGAAAAEGLGEAPLAGADVAAVVAVHGLR